MSYVLNPIFITNHGSISDEKILNELGLKGLIKGESVDFYDTNKNWNTIFMGSRGDCKILCNGDLCNEAFEDESILLTIKDCEIAAIIWNESVSMYGLCLIKNGKVERKVMVIDGDLEHNYGQPIQEELDISEDELFEPEEMEEIIDSEGETGLKRMIESEKICRATNNIVKRYLGFGIVEIQERIELNKYEKE